MMCTITGWGKRGAKDEHGTKILHETEVRTNLFKSILFQQQSENVFNIFLYIKTEYGSYLKVFPKSSFSTKIKI